MQNLFIAAAFAGRTAQQMVPSSSYEFYLPQGELDAGLGNYQAMYWLDNETGTVDSNGNGCDWYDQYAYDQSFSRNPEFESNCGVFDTPDFKAKQQCAICRGGLMYGFACQSAYEGQDAAGNRCFDRTYHDMNDGPYCGENDTTTFKASDECCLCGGGNRQWIDPWDVEWGTDSPYPLDTPYRHATACVELGYFKDSNWNTCSYYARSDTTKAECGVYDTPHFKAAEECCACGGGEIKEIRVPIVATDPIPYSSYLTLAARYLGEDTISGKYLSQDMGYASYLLAAALALPTLLFMSITGPFLLLGQLFGANWINGHEKIFLETLEHEVVPLGVALTCVVLISVAIIKTRNQRKGRDDYHVAQEI